MPVITLTGIDPVARSTSRRRRVRLAIVNGTARAVTAATAIGYIAFATNEPTLTPNLLVGGWFAVAAATVTAARPSAPAVATTAVAVSAPMPFTAIADYPAAAAVGVAAALCLLIGRSLTRHPPPGW